MNIILAVGNTGCGKSTMLTSLMYGPEALELTKIDYEIKIPHQKGKLITNVKKKPVIEQKVPLNVFKIGHSDSESETFLPTFVKHPN